MGLATFTGGIHPYDGKKLSMDKPTTILMPKGDLVFPMSQHIGEPAKPIVAVGDKVLVGQKIGEATGNISACVISSVSGTVKAIEDRLNVTGVKVLSIVIENDGEYQGIDGFGTKVDVNKLTKAEIRSKIKEAGIVGLGGAGFPTHIKLTPKDDSKIDYVIVNAAECEPYLTSDYRLLMEEPEKLISGLNILLKLFDNAKGVIAIEDNKPEAIEKLNGLVKKESKIELKVLKTKYPQGSERLIISAITKRKINSKMLPSDVGCIVDNVDTVISIYSAVAENIPLIRKIVTVTGDAITDPRNFNVRLGTSFTELIEAAGGFKTKPEKIISGGSMMGKALHSVEVPVSKISSGILCVTVDEVAANPTTACIRCGRCADVCPSRVVPQKMYQAYLRNDLEEFQRLNGMECCECGACTFACPAKIQLTQGFDQAKKSIRENSTK